MVSGTTVAVSITILKLELSLDVVVSGPEVTCVVTSGVSEVTLSVDVKSVVGGASELN